MASLQHTMNLQRASMDLLLSRMTQQTTEAPYMPRRDSGPWIVDSRTVYVSPVSHLPFQQHQKQMLQFGGNPTYPAGGHPVGTTTLQWTGGVPVSTPQQYNHGPVGTFPAGAMQQTPFEPAGSYPSCPNFPTGPGGGIPSGAIPQQSGLNKDKQPMFEQQPYQPMQTSPLYPQSVTNTVTFPQSVNQADPSSNMSIPNPFAEQQQQQIVGQT